MRPVAIAPHKPMPFTASTLLNRETNSPIATSAVIADATHTPLCRLLRSWLNVAFSFVRTTLTPTSEARMPIPASAIGATASFIPTAADSSPRPMPYAAAAPSAIEARMEP